MTESLVYAVIVNFRNYLDTIDCIKHLLLSSYKNLKIVVIDNDSKNDSLNFIEEWIKNFKMNSSTKRLEYNMLYEEEELLSFHSKITLVQSNSNKGFAAGNNIALKKLLAIDCFVFLVNPDIVVSENTVEELLVFANAHSKKVIISPAVMFFQTERVKHYGIKLHHLTGTMSEALKENESFDYICGGASFFHSCALKDVGLLPENYFLYWEDADWSYHAKKAGYNLVSCTSSIVYDKGSTSIGRGYLAEYYYTRNSLLFHRKIKKQVVTIILSNLFFRLSKKILLGQMPRAKAVLRGTFDFIIKKNINEPKKEINIG